MLGEHTVKTEGNLVYNTCGIRGILKQGVIYDMERDLVGVPVFVADYIDMVKYDSYSGQVGRRHVAKKSQIRTYAYTGRDDIRGVPILEGDTVHLRRYNVDGDELPEPGDYVVEKRGEDYVLTGIADAEELNLRSYIRSFATVKESIITKLLEQNKRRNK